MRPALDEALTTLASQRPDVHLVVADVGSFPRFRERFENRFLNVGVSEALSVSLASGLASEGRKVFLYTVAGFTLYRAFEQIKFSVGFWKQDVTIIGTGFGWRYSRIGRGHRTPDDLALMRLVPNIKVFAPATPSALSRMILAEESGPRFIRLGEGGLPGSEGAIPGRGSLATILALGEMYLRMVRPVQVARSAGYDIGLRAIEDLSVAAIAQASQPADRHIVIEDHVAIGGLADAVRQAGRGVHAHLHLPLDVDKIAMSQDELLAAFGFSEDGLTAWLLEELKTLAGVAR